MAEPAKQSRQDPEIKQMIGERFSKVVKMSGLDPAVISFRCGWKSRSRIFNYMGGVRTPGAQELLELDKVMYPIFDEYVSFYILYGKRMSEVNQDADKPAITQAAINRAFTGLISDYVEMRRIELEPKLSASKMIEDFMEVYLPRELSGNQQES